MRPVQICLSALLLAACSGNAPPPIGGSGAFSGNVELRSCSDGAPAPALERCGIDASGTIAAVCGDLEEHNTLTVNGGSLAVSGQSQLAAPLHVDGGSFTGFAGIEGDNTQDVTGDLSTAGDWVVHAPAHVGGAAFIGGNLQATNTVEVGGLLHVTPSDMTNVTAAGVTADGTAVSNPIACTAPAVTLPAIARIEAGRFVDLGDALFAHSHPAQVNLGCARYRFSAWGIDNQLSLRVSGSTVIVVDGDVRIGAPVRVELDPGASLDFIVGGSLQVDNTLTFAGGSTWLAVASDLRVGAPLQLDGSIYAPTSTVSADNTLEVTGSLFVGPLRVASPVNVIASGDELPACGAVSP